MYFGPVCLFSDLLHFFLFTMVPLHVLTQVNTEYSVFLLPISKKNAARASVAVSLALDQARVMGVKHNNLVKAQSAAGHATLVQQWPGDKGTAPKGPTVADVNRVCCALFQ